MADTCHRREWRADSQYGARAEGESHGACHAISVEADSERELPTVLRGATCRVHRPGRFTEPADCGFAFGIEACHSRGRLGVRGDGG